MEIADKVSDFAHEAGDRFTSAKEAVSDKSEQLLNAEQRLMKNCQRYVRDNPVTSLGIAVATGFLLSRLSSGR
jgi:ElaB/YqjD/DUF883 family membrane-anchored ribosome-binding protein